MKGRQICELLIGLPFLFLCLSGLTYFLGTFNLRLALVVEFTLLAAMIMVWFTLLDRVLNHASTTHRFRLGGKRGLASPS